MYLVKIKLAEVSSFVIYVNILTLHNLDYGNCATAKRMFFLLLNILKAIYEMKVGPSNSVFRNRIQTTFKSS